MLSFRPLVLALTLAFVAPMVSAAPPAASPAKKELIAKIIKLQQSEMEGVARMLTAQALQSRLQAVNQALAQVPTEKREALMKDVQDDLRKTAGEIEPLLKDKAQKIAPAILSAELEEKFTEDELRQVVQWLDSPISRKFFQYGVQTQNTVTQKLIAETRANVDPKLQALDSKLKGRFSPPAAAGGK